MSASGQSTVCRFSITLNIIINLSWIPLILYCEEMERRWVWLRIRVSGLLLEGHWFESPGLYVEVSLGKKLNPKLLLMCWSAPCMAASALSV